MKKFTALIAAICILCSNICLASSLPELGAGIEMQAIMNNTDSNRLKFNITLPTVYDDCSFFIVFYNNGTAVNVRNGRDESIPYSKAIILTPNKTTHKINAQYSQSPDSIKMFMWKSGSIMPVTCAQDVLTADAIEAANKDVISNLTTASKTTGFIKRDPNNYMYQESLEVEGVQELMALLTDCAVKLIEEGETKLLTSSYAREFVSTELDEIKDYATDKDIQDACANILLNISQDKYYDAVTNALGFLDIELNIKEKGAAEV